MKPLSCLVVQLLFSGTGLLAQVCAGELAATTAVTALAAIVAFVNFEGDLGTYVYLFFFILFSSSHFIVSIFGR